MPTTATRPAKTLSDLRAVAAANGWHELPGHFREEILLDGTLYDRVTPDAVRAIVSRDASGMAHRGYPHRTHHYTRQVWVVTDGRDHIEAMWSFEGEPWLTPAHVQGLQHVDEAAQFIEAHRRPASTGLAA